MKKFTMPAFFFFFLPVSVVVGGLSAAGPVRPGDVGWLDVNEGASFE